MHRCSIKSLLCASLVMALAAGCSPPATPQVDVVASAVAEVAYGLLTQTAAAASPTPTITATPAPTETPTLTPTSSEPPEMPRTVNFAACYLGGPAGSWVLESNIKQGKGVDLLGVGNIPGWYVIRNPYFHRPCWIMALDLRIAEGTDLSTFPVMTPGIPLMGQ